MSQQGEDGEKPVANDQTSNQEIYVSSSHAVMVGSHFTLGKRIGNGNFGEVRIGRDLRNNVDVAIKMEPNRKKMAQLAFEYKMYKLLGATDIKHRMEGIPKVYYYGPAGKRHNALVLDILGPTLENIFNLFRRKFSLKTTLLIAIQTLARIETVHNKGLVYRDIKPENFVIGRQSQKKENRIYIIDFGLAKEYMDPNTKQHIPYKEKKILTGTARYMSINTHLGKEQSRRDDLESLGHMYMYFLKGALPWQGLRVQRSKDRLQKIGEMKRTIPINVLCDGYPEFEEYLQYVRHLNFDEDPNYEYLRKIFVECLSKNGWTNDNIFEWM